MSAMGLLRNMTSKNSTKVILVDILLICIFLGVCYTSEITKNNINLKKCLDLCKKDNCIDFCYTSTGRSCVFEVLDTSTAAQETTAASAAAVTSDTSTAEPGTTAASAPAVTSDTSTAEPGTTTASAPAVTSDTSMTEPGTTAAVAAAVTSDTSTAEPGTTAALAAAATPDTSTVEPQTTKAFASAVTSAVECPFLVPPNYGSVSYPSGRLIQYKARFTCTNLSTLIGSKELTCTASGNWNGTTPTCELDLPVRSKDCKTTPQGLAYNGTMSITNDGPTYPCIRWDAKTGTGFPRWLVKRLYNIPETNLADAANYCRNFDEARRGPWCYTNDPNSARGFQFCPVPFCKCIIPYEEFNGKCVKYEEHIPAISWSAAQLNCRADNATLMMYKDIPISHAVNFARHNGYTGNKNIAVGGIYNATTSTWYWVDKSPINDIPWDTTASPPQPEGNGQDCLSMSIDTELIHDVHCTNNLRIEAVLCQKNFSP